MIAARLDQLQVRLVQSWLGHDFYFTSLFYNSVVLSQKTFLLLI